MERGAWLAAVHRVANSQTQLKRLSKHACMHAGSHTFPVRNCIQTSSSFTPLEQLPQSCWEALSLVITLSKVLEYNWDSHLLGCAFFHEKWRYEVLKHYWNIRGDWKLFLFSSSVVSDSLWPHDCNMPGFPVLHYLPEFVQTHVHWVGRWCHPTTSSSVAPFSSCPPQSFPASGSFPMSQLFASGGQNIGASVSASVLPMNIQGWFPLGLTGFTLKSLLQHRISKAGGW